MKTHISLESGTSTVSKILNTQPVINKRVSERPILFSEIKLLECVDVSEGLSLFVRSDEMMRVGHLMKESTPCKCKRSPVVHLHVSELGYFFISKHTPENHQ